MSAPVAAEPVREGFMIGASLGGGGASACSGDCVRLSGGAAEIHVGGWLTPRWALSYEVWIVSDTGNGFNTNGTGASLATVTTRLGSRAWLKGGAGLALYMHDDAFAMALHEADAHFTYRGVGLAAGAGYELYQSSGSFVIDVSARGITGLFPGHGANLAASLLVGVSWN